MHIIIIAILVIIAIGIGLYFGVFKQPYKISSIKTYTAPDRSFSFQYPEFEGWRYSSANYLIVMAPEDPKPEENGAINNNDVEFIGFDISVDIKPAPGYPIEGTKLPLPPSNNPNGVGYNTIDRSLDFFSDRDDDGNIKIVKIKFTYLLSSMEDRSFSSKKMAEMIIKSFKFSAAK